MAPPKSANKWGKLLPTHLGTRNVSGGRVANLLVTGEDSEDESGEENPIALRVSSKKKWDDEEEDDEARYTPPLSF